MMKRLECRRRIKPAQGSSARCSFCWKWRDEVRVLLTGVQGKNVCDECILLSFGMIVEEIEKVPA
jgi:hypothetical protein